MYIQWHAVSYSTYSLRASGLLCICWRMICMAGSLRMAWTSGSCLAAFLRDSGSSCPSHLRRPLLASFRGEHSLTHSHSHMHPHSLTHTVTCTHTHLLTQSHAHTLTTHSHGHMHNEARAFTHSLTHTQSRGKGCVLILQYRDGCPPHFLFR